MNVADRKTNLTWWQKLRNRRATGRLLNEIAEFEIIFDEIPETEKIKFYNRIFSRPEYRNLSLNNLNRNLSGMVGLKKEDLRETLSEEESRKVLSKILGAEDGMTLGHHVNSLFGWTSRQRAFKLAGVSLVLMIIVAGFFSVLVRTSSGIGREYLTVLENGSEKQMAGVTTGDRVGAVLFGNDVHRNSWYFGGGSAARTVIFRFAEPPAAQALSIAADSEVEISFGEKSGLEISLVRGSVFYSGHKGVPVTLYSGNNGFQLLGTKVQLESSEGSRLMILEGSVRINSAGRETMAGVGEKVTLRDGSLVKQKLSATEVSQLTRLDASMKSSSTVQTEQNGTLAPAAVIAAVKPAQKISPVRNPISRKPLALRDQLGRIAGSSRQIIVFTHNGSRVQGRVTRIENDEFIMETAFGTFRKRIDQVEKISVVE